MAQPKLRIKGFEGEWKEELLSTIATFSKGRGYSKADICEKGTPIVLYGRMYTNYSTEIHNVDTFAVLKDNPVISKGNEIIIPASGETPEDIACASVIKSKGIIIGGDLNIVSVDSSDYDPSFTALSITYGDAHRELSKSAQGKTVVHLHNSEISKSKLRYPLSIEEQRQIVAYFKSLDSLIQTTTKKIESLKQLKSASLVSMFPQGDEKAPRVRFKGFKGEWLCKKIGDCLDEIVTKNCPIQTDFILSLTIKDGVLPYSEKGNIGNRAKEDVSQYKLAYPNTIVLNSMNILIGAIGLCDYFGCVSPVYCVFQCKENVNRRFIFDIMANRKFQIELKKIATGVMEIRQKVSIKELIEKKILIPSIEEQIRISSYFSSLDSQISIQEHRLEKLKQIKASCLEKMFV